MTRWIDNAVFWHLYPLGFVGAEPRARPDVRHRLGHIVDWLDYAVALVMIIVFVIAPLLINLARDRISVKPRGREMTEVVAAT